MAVSSAMTKQAVSIWLYTGAPTTNLASMDSWTSILLQNYHTQAQISTLRFGTAGGLEESGNRTSSGANILRRDASSYSECLKVYLADGITLDTGRTAKCDYDPKYTSWYQAGFLAANSSTFSDTYDNSWLAAVSKACAASNCSNGILGVWASEWQISSISFGLAQLIDGFEGSLAVIDFNGIVLATSSGVTVEPALTCNDSFIREGSKESVGNTNYFKDGWSGALLRETFIGIDVLSFLDFANFPDVTTEYFGMMALQRRQLYGKYEEVRNTGIAVVLFGLIFVGLIVDKFMDKTKSRLKLTHRRNKKICENFEETMESPFVKAMRKRFHTSIQALECHLELHPVRLSDLKYLDSSAYDSFLGNATLSAGRQELSKQEALQWVAISFMQDLSLQRDTETHLALLLCGSTFRLWLMPLFRAFSTWWYWWAVSILLGGVLWLEMHGSTWQIIALFDGWLETVLLALLCVDAILCCLFYTIKCKPRHISGTLDKVVTVPGTIQIRFIAGCLYLLLVVAALVAHTLVEHSSIVAYSAPLLVLLRNDNIW